MHLSPASALDTITTYDNSCDQFYVRQQCAHLDAALQRTPHLCALMIEYRREYKRISCTLILTARYTWRGGAPACFRTSSYLEVADGATPKNSSELLFFRGGREGEFLIHTSYIVLLSLSWGGVGLCGWIISGDSAHTSSLRRLHRRWISSRCTSRGGSFSLMNRDVYLLVNIYTYIYVCIYIYI